MDTLTVAERISKGLEVMGIGVGVVFFVLAVFFFVIKLMMKIWPAKEDA